MLNGIIDKFGLIAFDSTKSIIARPTNNTYSIVGIKKSDNDTFNTFKELTETIDEMISAIPNIMIPSTIVGKSKYEGFKEVVALYKKQNLSKLLLLSCTMVNLIARHSGAKDVSKIAGFMQNCLALYSIGDNLCSHISFNWDYADTLYIMASNELPDGINLSLAKFREYLKTFNKNNYNSCRLTPTSISVLAKIMCDKQTFIWESSNDQFNHTIVPLRTNITGYVSHCACNDDNNKDEYEHEINYEFGDYGLNSDDKHKHAIFEFKFDNVIVYAIQSVSATDSSENADNKVYSPSSEVKYFWIPDGGEVLNSDSLTDTIERFLELLFVYGMDTSKFMFTFDSEGEIQEISRPTAIPTHYVSDSIPSIINAIQTLHSTKLSRSYALVGQAGTGKTIGAQQISNAFSDVCTFKITKDTIENDLASLAMINYIKAIKRCIIILDDMDRSNLQEKNDAVCSYLQFFDNLNQAAKNDHISYVFIATINDPSKINKLIMCRSGRIDQMVEIGYPDIKSLRYLFKYNDEQINPGNPTDFDSNEFDDAFKYAIDSKITAADIGNIFADMVIYGTKDDTFTPDNVVMAINHIKGRNLMSTNNYMD